MGIINQLISGGHLAGMAMVCCDHKTEDHEWWFYPPVIKHGWLENGPFIGDCSNKPSIRRGLSGEMFDYQRVGIISWVVV